MRMIQRLIPSKRLLLLGVAALLAISAGAASPAELPAPLTSALARYKIPRQNISLWVQDVDQDQPLLAHNPDLPRSPASTIKLLTTFVALDLLGPVYTWKTEVYTHGAVVDGTLKGDLVIKGYGDPFLVPEQFWILVQRIRGRGIEHIQGDLVIDNFYFATGSEDRNAFDGQGSRAYNAHPDALLVNFQSILFEIVPDRLGSGVRVIPEPRPDNLLIENHLRLSGGRCRGARSHVGMHISQAGPAVKLRLTGDYPAACGESRVPRVVMPNPDLAYGVFKSLWKEMGGTISGGHRVANTPASARLLYTHESRTLADLIRGLNKFSNNVMARQLLLTLSAERLGQPGTANNGSAVVKEWLSARGLGAGELLLENGSGLSRTTRIAPATMARLLAYAYKSPYMAEFIASLPLAGIDGTMRNRLKGQPITGQAHLKTGQINGVAGIAGFVKNRLGKTFIVVCMLNHPGVDQGPGKRVIDDLLKWVYQHT